jgi:hypothetical protein
MQIEGRAGRGKGHENMGDKDAMQNWNKAGIEIEVDVELEKI